MNIWKAAAAAYAADPSSRNGRLLARAAEHIDSRSSLMAAAAVAGIELGALEPFIRTAELAAALLESKERSSAGAKNPMQPVFIENGLAVFRENKIVRDRLGDLRSFELEPGRYSQEDVEQLAQLCGWTVRSFCEVYPDSEHAEAARAAADALLGGSGASTPKPEDLQCAAVQGCYAVPWTAG